MKEGEYFNIALSVSIMAFAPLLILYNLSSMFGYVALNAVIIGVLAGSIMKEREERKRARKTLEQTTNIPEFFQQ